MPNATFEQLNAFVAVAEHGSYSQAARKIGKDRSTLHRQVAELEIDWGVTLFERSGRSPVLTDDGQSLLRPSRFIVYQMNALEVATDSLSAGQKTELTLCYDPSIPVEVITGFDEQIRQIFPQTIVNWLQRTLDDALAMLEQGGCDFAITLNKGAIHPDKGISFLNLGYPKFDFFVHQESDLLNRGRVSMAELQLQRQFVLEGFTFGPLGNQTKISSKVSLLSDPRLLVNLLCQEGYALLPTFLIKQFGPELKKLEVDFAVQSGHYGYVLLSPSTSVPQPLEREVTQLISQWFVQETLG
ncbi:LysR family transcriptional regulator [Vibrio sp. WXL103]|uniref:LysR family transcriptional regulator n=1 Tax=Vibrio sp. WXL103 TaxID=3450710 RepID=UPI003EC4DE45